MRTSAATTSAVVWSYLEDLLDRRHAELQRAVVHEPENVAEPGSCQPLHVDLVLVPLPHVCCEHDPEVVALGGQQRLVGLQEDAHTGHTEHPALIQDQHYNTYTILCTDFSQL